MRQVPASPALLDLLVRVHSLDNVEPGRRLWRWQRTRAWELVKGVMAAARIYHLPASPKGLRHAFGCTPCCPAYPCPWCRDGWAMPTCR